MRCFDLTCVYVLLQDIVVCIVWFVSCALCFVLLCGVVCGVVLWFGVCCVMCVGALVCGCVGMYVVCCM